MLLRHIIETYILDIEMELKLGKLNRNEVILNLSVK